MATTPARDAEQVDDREVLARLRHDAVVGGDHEQHDVDAGGAGDHLAHEPLVAGDVDDAHRAPARQRRAARSPSSMVTPRSFSSGRRSGSVPVSALTSADLPWSMCPAVPRTSEGDGIGAATPPPSISPSRATIDVLLGGREQGARVDEQAVVVDARDDRGLAAAAQAAPRARSTRIAARRDRDHDASGCRRAAAPRRRRATMSSAVVDVTRRRRRRSRMRAASASARTRDLGRDAVSMRSVGISRSGALRVEVDAQRRLERGERHLVEPQRARQRVLLQRAG